MKNKRSRETPYRVVNVMTGEVLEWYATAFQAHMSHKGEPIDVQYMPPRGKRK
jgi:hypothetical protein